MRATSELLRVAIGAPNLVVPSRFEPGARSDLFDVFRILLPLPDFRGLPPEWTFLVLKGATVKEQKLSEQMVFDDARAIVQRLSTTERAVFVSDVPNIHLGGEFEVGERPIFCIDENELPKAKSHIARPEHAPFILAVKRRLMKTPGFIECLSPYQRKKPVSGSRFFGRERELRHLVTKDENFVVVGARRCGKTSLLKEVERRLIESGEEAYYINVSNYEDVRDVISAILRELAPRLLSDAVRHGHAMNESALEHALRRVTRGNTRTTLLIDEMGNVLENIKDDSWSFLGILRNFSQYGRLRIIFSCFQEAFLRQQADLSDPLVNFGVFLRLGLFSDREVEEFVLSPHEFWKPIKEEERRVLLETVLSTVGGHPLLLQYLCTSLFEGIAQQENIVHIAKTLLRKDLFHCLGEPTEEVFHRIKSVLLRYLFMRRCKESHDRHEELRSARIDDHWINHTLRSIGYESTFNGRSNLLDGLEVHGLCARVDGRRSVQVIAAPAIYLVVKKDHEDIDGLLSTLLADVKREVNIWELTPLPSVFAE